MKKLLILALLLFSSVASVAHAGTIDLTNYISGNDVTIAALASDNTTLENFANGGVEGGTNIKEASIVSKDLSNAISPVTRWQEAFNDFTYTGMLPATSTAPDMFSDISAGTSYVNGIRVTKTATAHTYTVSKDTYVYIHEGGSYLYEVEDFGETPTAPDNTLLLAKVVTDADNITSVSDMRTTAIQLTLNSSSFASDYRTGADLVYDSSTTMHVEPGHLSIGTTNYTRTTNSTTLDMTTEADWIEGDNPATAGFTNPVMYIYAFNDSGTSWDIKFSSADPVNSSPGSGTDGLLRYYTVGGTDYRLLGWAYVSADAIYKSVFSNIKEHGYQNRINVTDQTEYSANGTITFDDSKPQRSEGDYFTDFAIKPTRAESRIGVTVSCQLAGSGQRVIALFKDGGSSAIATSVSLASAAGNVQESTLHYESAASATTLQTYEIRWGATSNDGLLNVGGSSYALGGTMTSSAIIQEF